MKLIKIFSLIMIGSFLFVYCKGLQHINNKKSIANKADSLDVYLLIGQSNMAGRAPIEVQDKDSLKNVYLFTDKSENRWEKAANPLNKYSSIRKKLVLQKLNPGYTFAKEMASKSSSPIGLVVNAKGGTNIALWVPGSEFYNDAVSRTKEALKNGKLKGILWHQGEANASKYKQYMPHIVALIKALRADFDQPDLPFVACQLSEDKVKRKNFNKMILTLPQEMEHVGVVTTENTKTIDNTHFNSASQRELGKRYATKMLNLLQR